MHTLFKTWEEPDHMPPGENALSPAERESLVTGNLGLARTLAAEAARYDANSDAENLYGDACLYMVEAARRWHPPGSPGNPKGTPFWAYAAAYLRRRLVGQVIDATPRDGRTVVRGLDMGALTWRPNDDTPADMCRPDEYDRELLAALKPDAREVVEAVVFERITPAAAAVRFGRPEKDISLILRNSVPLLLRRKERVDADDLFDAETAGAA